MLLWKLNALARLAPRIIIAKSPTSMNGSHSLTAPIDK